MVKVQTAKELVCMEVVQSDIEKPQQKTDEQIESTLVQKILSSSTNGEKITEEIIKEEISNANGNIDSESPIKPQQADSPQKAPMTPGPGEGQK
jgi:uncharacterized phage protein gp47/JayE